MFHPPAEPYDSSEQEVRRQAHPFIVARANSFPVKRDLHPPYSHSEISREDGTVVHRSQLGGWNGESLVSKEESGSDDEDEEESVGDESTNL